MKFKILSANLIDHKKDFLEILEKAKTEVPFLYLALIDGKIDGSQYKGECAGLRGTIANARHCTIEEIAEIGIMPKYLKNSPAEKLFLAIQRGDTPDNNPFSEIVKGWIEEFCEEHRIVLPTRTVVLR